MSMVSNLLGFNKIFEALEPPNYKGFHSFLVILSCAKLTFQL